MRLSTIYYYVSVAAVLFMAACSCNNNNKAKNNGPEVFKGLYSFGPEVKSFQECGHDADYWVTDSSAQLELQYSQLNFEKPYEPVYIEVEGIKKASDKEGLGSEFDSTLVVRKLIKITREIPQDSCR
jgi:copper homeostasis protein (lipoprotein)